MATLTKNREIRYDGGWLEFIEHKTGKRILSWRREMNRLGMSLFFTDNTMLYLEHGDLFPDEPKYEPMPKSICVSCGQDHHATYWNWKGQCTATVSKFWHQVRKVFWHRYQKLGHL